MKKYSIVSNKFFNNILLYILLLSTILLSRDTLISSIRLGFYKSFFIYIGIILIVILGVCINLIKNNEFKICNINKNLTVNILIFIGLIFVTSLIKFDFQMYIISIIFYILVTYIFVNLFEFEDFFKKFSNIMVFLSIISLIMCYVFRGTILFPGGVISSNIPVVVNSAGVPFFDFGLSYVVAWPYYIRNFGVFREPGVYQFFLLMPFIYEVLIERKKVRYFNIIVLLLTVVSTFSLAGILVMILVIFVYIARIIVEKKDTKKRLTIIVLLGIIGLIIMTLFYMNNYNLKSIIDEAFKKLTTVNESSSARMESIINNIKFFITSPIWGRKFAYVQYASQHNTNSTLSIFAIFGVIVGFLHVYFLYVLTAKVSNNKKIRIAVLIIMFMLINSQFLIGNTMFWVITFSVFMISEENDSEYDELDIQKLFIKSKEFIKKIRSRS